MKQQPLKSITKPVIYTYSNLLNHKFGTNWRILWKDDVDYLFFCRIAKRARHAYGSAPQTSCLLVSCRAASPRELGTHMVVCTSDILPPGFNADSFKPFLPNCRESQAPTWWSAPQTSCLPVTVRTVTSHQVHHIFFELGQEGIFIHQYYNIAINCINIPFLKDYVVLCTKLHLTYITSK